MYQHVLSLDQRHGKSGSGDCGGQAFFANGDTGGGRVVTAKTSSGGGSHSHEFTTTLDGEHNHDIIITSVGGGQAHENRPPYYALFYIMKL